MRALLRGQPRRLVLVPENPFEGRILVNWSKKQPKVKGYAIETIGGKRTWKDELTIVFEIQRMNEK